MAPGKKYPLLLKCKTSSFPSRDVQNSNFQPLQTTVPLLHKEKPCLDTHYFELQLKARTQINCSQPAPAASPLFCLVVHECGKKQTKEISPEELLGAPSFPAAPAAFCSPNHSQQTEMWGHQSCFIRTPWVSDLSSVLFLESGRSGTTRGWKRHPWQINSAESSNMRMNCCQGVGSNFQNKKETQGKLMIKRNTGFAKGQPARHQLILWNKYFGLHS